MRRSKDFECRGNNLLFLQYTHVIITCAVMVCTTIKIKVSILKNILNYDRQMRFIAYGQLLLAKKKIRCVYIYI